MNKLIIAILSFLAISCASAQEFKIDLGVTQFSRIENGNWYQEQLPFTLRLTSLSASLAIYTDKDESRWQFGGGYDYIGRATSDAMIYDVDNCHINCGPVSHMQGQGTIPAIFVGARRTMGSWFIEPQLYLTRPHWETTNFDWYGSSNYSVGPIYSHLNNEVKNTYGIGAAIGYALSKDFSATLKIVPTHSSAGDNPAIYKGVSPTMAVEYSF